MIPLLLLFVLPQMKGQITVDAPCAIGTLTFDLNIGLSPDGSGRNVYTNDSSQTHIKYNPSLTRWEIISYGSEEFVYYATGVNTFAPDPPNSATEPYPLIHVGLGCLDEGPATVSGGQDVPGNDPCMNLGGDSDGDGICDDNDVCPGRDDNMDMDGDGIPDGCDFEPDIPLNSVYVTALCLSPDPLEFLLAGNSGGYNVYVNALAQLEIRFNGVTNQWEIKAQAPGTEVFFINDFPSIPNPPDDVTNPWTSVNIVCDTTPATVDGDGTQDMLIIPTLSQWGIIILGLVMIIFGYLFYNEKLKPTEMVY